MLDMKGVTCERIINILQAVQEIQCKNYIAALCIYVKGLPLKEKIKQNRVWETLSPPKH